MCAAAHTPSSLSLMTLPVAPPNGCVQLLPDVAVRSNAMMCTLFWNPPASSITRLKLPKSLTLPLVGLLSALGGFGRLLHEFTHGTSAVMLVTRNAPLTFRSA